MKPTCPKCGGEIDPADVNVAKAVLFCRDCNELFPLEQREIVTPVPEFFDITDTPHGVELLEEFDGVTIKAKPMGIGGTLFALVFGVMFGGGGCGVLYDALMGKETVEIGQVFFSLPFLLVGLGAWCVVVMKLIGYTSVLISSTRCRVFTGVGSIGFKKEFAFDDVAGIERDCYGQSNGRPVYRLKLIMESGKDIKFGMFIPEKNQPYVKYAVLTMIEKLRG